MLLVGIVQTLAGLKQVIESIVDGQPAVLAHDRSHVESINELHDQKVSAFDFVGVVSRDDVGMAKASGGFDLALKARQRIRFFNNFGRKYLKGDEALHAGVLGLQHYAHPAFAELIEDAVIAQDQILSFALVNHLGLIGRQFLLLYQLTRTLLTI